MYRILRTATADAGISRIILYINEKFGAETALRKLEELESDINRLAEDPYIGTDPKFMVLQRQGYKVLITEKDLVFYKIFDEEETVIIYAVTDQRQDYLDILRGM